MKRLALGGAALALLAGGLAAAAAHGLIFHDSSRPESVTAALKVFRSIDPHPSDPDGVYVYDTTGGESIDVLGGARHRYPATTAIVVTRASCGLRLLWQPLALRSTTWTLCGESLAGSDEVHSFFGHSDRTTYSCSGSAETFTCRSAHNRVAGVATLTPGSTQVRVRMTLRISGQAHGTQTLTWLIPTGTGVPQRIVVSSRTSRREPIVGTANYRESAVLQLESAKPLR
ncbi:MAG TPA: hypothetical protein VHD91_01095 [Gaiellaceae bacterium]|nr:hypothetical protein [Gaiellaceae bacterium]